MPVCCRLNSCKIALAKVIDLVPLRAIVDPKTQLRELYYIMMLQIPELSYPYGGTVNFKICLEVQLTTHQSPMPNSSQLALGLIGISDVGVVKRRFPYWIQKDIESVKQKDPLLDL